MCDVMQTGEGEPPPLGEFMYPLMHILLIPVLTILSHFVQEFLGVDIVVGEGLFLVQHLRPGRLGLPCHDRRKSAGKTSGSLNTGPGTTRKQKTRP